MLGGYYSHNPLHPPYLKGDIKGENAYPKEDIEVEPPYLKGDNKGEDLYLRGVKRLLIFERELAGKTELLRFWKSQTVTSVK